MISLVTYPLVFPGEIDKNENFFGKLIMEESDISDPFTTSRNTLHIFLDTIRVFLCCVQCGFSVVFLVSFNLVDFSQNLEVFF